MRIVVEPKGPRPCFAVEATIIRSDDVPRIETSQPMTWAKARKAVEAFERMGIKARVVDSKGRVGTGMNGRHL